MNNVGKFQITNSKSQTISKLQLSNGQNCLCFGYSNFGNWNLFGIWRLMFGILFVSGCATEYNPGTHRQDLMFYSTESEVSMGQAVARAIAKDKEMSISNDSNDIKRVNKIGDKIAGVCDRGELTYYFYVLLDEKEVNAFSLPGGYVYIFKKLLDDLNDDELAFVLAHEVAHIVSRHAVKALQAAIAANILTVAGAVAPGGNVEFAQGLAFALAQIMVGYSREDEFNADEQAVKYTKACGYDPKAGINVMEKLYKEGKKTINPLSLFRTHPYAAQRIRHIKETLHLPLAAADYLN
jgi:beta-barrel assembly-enhancing protease